MTLLILSLPAARGRASPDVVLIGKPGGIFESVQIERNGALPRYGDFRHTVEIERLQLNGERRAVFERDNERDLVAQKTVEHERHLARLVEVPDKIERIVLQMNLAIGQAGRGNR